MSRNILEELQVIREALPAVEISTSTNGVMVNSEDKRRAALLMDRVVFSIDGCSQETLTRYQIGSDFDKAYENLCRLVELRDREGRIKPRIVWKYVVFKWNDRAEHLERVTELARKAQVDALEFLFTLNPYWAISWRFFTASHWRKLGPVQGKQRVIKLR
jgi:MoaA/NifB/PqqE/SkfB family radical SAM enzyme